MIRRSADRQAEYWWSDVLLNWAERVDALDLAVVDAVSSGIVITVPREAVRRGDLIVRNPDGSFGSFRLIARRPPDPSPQPRVR
jgi:hypothetical protein